MFLKKVEIKNFRNLEECTVSFHQNVNVITGKNAQGKTNLLEAIWLLSGNKSFRAAGDHEMIGFDKSSYFIGGSFDLNGEDVVLKIGCQSEGEKIKKKVYRNGKTFLTSRALLSAAVMTVFSPDDLEIIKSAPSLRRNYCDVLLSSLFPFYAKTLSRYNRIVMQKNALLKDERPEQEIEIWNEQLSLFAANITKSRTELLKRLLPYAKKNFYELSGKTEELSIEYKSSVVENCELQEAEIAEKIKEKISQNSYKERAAGCCLYGPHRDDLLFFINGREARQFASQGQQRSAVLSLLLAKTEIIKDHTGEAPIVLLDDVMSELDSTRQNFLLEKINDFQVIITCCQDSFFDCGSGKKTFEVKNGIISERK